MAKDVLNKERTDFRWAQPQNSDVIFIEGREIGATEWYQAAEISASDARVTQVLSKWKDDPALFDICSGICADIRAEEAA